MSSQRYDAIPEFTLLAPTIWEYVPSQPTQHQSIHQSAESPSLIVLLPWTGANGRHVAKYTSTYQTLFPLARILCITTSAKDLTLRSSKRKQERLRPAIERILAHQDEQGGHANVLLHAFSEGGSNKTVELAEAYYNATGSKLPCTAMCLDSTPGHPRYLRLCNALKKSLPPIPILNHTGLLVGSALLGSMWVFYRGFKGPENNVISRTRERLQDPRHWDPSAPRCYFYSKGDALISWRDIREHMGETVQSGAPVMDVCFEESDHCRHAAQEPERYWGAVYMTWKRSCINKEKLGSMMNSRGSEETLVVPEGLWPDSKNQG